MYAYYRKCLLLVASLLILSLQLEAQSTYVLSAGEFTVAGTSSLHDWTMTSKDARGEAAIALSNNMLQEVKKLAVNLKSESLKSGKSGMDSNAYKALESRQYPDIGFNLKSIKSISKKDGHFLVEAEGTLTIAGVSRTMRTQARAFLSGKTIKFSGSKTFKMSDFQITPPTALMGTVKTGDEITINFDLTFQK